MDTLRTFVQQYLDGEIELYVKSEPVPDNNDPLKVSPPLTQHRHQLNLSPVCVHRWW